jgi:hypothetical protein
MKKVIMSCIVLLVAAVMFAQPPAGDARPGDSYGEKITAEGAIPLTDAVAKLNEGKESVDTKIKARIVEVCPKKGCWLKLQLNEKETAMVKMKDYGFFLPVSAKGKTVVIDGEVKKKTISVAELKHYAEDAKKSKEEIDAITKPEEEIRVTAKGIVVVE